MVGVNVPEKPEITNLAIDCNYPPAPGFCVAGGYPYPMFLNVTDANNCVATPTLSSGAGTPGSTSSVILNGTDGTFDFTTGSLGGSVIKVTVDCNGDGGFDSEFIEIQTY